MDFSSEQSADEARIMERQLYRPGQTPATPKAPAATTSTRVPVKTPSLTAAKNSSRATDPAKSAARKRLLLILVMGGFGYYLLFGTPPQRKRVLVGLGVAAWLFLLGGISYSLFLPDIKETAKNLAAIREDPNLTPEQKREKSREVFSNLTDGQRQQLFENFRKERDRKGNADIHKFLQMSPQEQVAYVKKQDEERKQRWAQWGGTRGGGQRGGPGGGGGAVGGGPGVAGGAGGAGGGGAGGRGAGAGGAGGAGRGPGGPGGGGPGGGGPGGFGGGGPGGVGGRGRMDFVSPESRAGFQYMRSLR